MTEIKDIPKGWRLKKLGEVCKLKNGYAFKSDSYENSGVPVIRISDINGGIVSSQKAVRVQSNEEYENYLVENNDILVAMSGATTGKFGIYKSTEKAYQNQRVGKFKILDEKILNNEFLYHQINSLKRQIEKDAYGGAQPNISSTKIEQMQIVVPPLPEQQAIVEKIEELLSDLENGKEQLQTAQQQLKVYRQSLLKWAFEGKLTNKDVKDGELPKGWKWVKNKELLKYVTSGSRDWKQYYSNKGSRFVRTQDINSNKLDLANSAYMDLPEKVEGKRSLIEEGDILMTITGANVGKVAVVDFPIEDAYVSQSVALLKYQDKRITKFLWYFFQAQGFGKSFIDKLVYGVGRPVLSLENMREVDVISCPIEDQQEIIDELESKLTVCDKIEETISQSLQQAETLRQSILKKAFEGKLVTNKK